MFLCTLTCILMIHVTFIAMIHVTLVMHAYASPSVAQVSIICLVTPPHHRHNHSLRHLSTEMPVKKKVEKDESTTKEAAASSRGTGDDIVAQVEAQQQLTAENNQPASAKNHVPLWQLNATTAKHAVWEVVVQHAHVEDYEYPWDNSMKKAQAFKCVLVYVHDPKQYCVGEVRKDKTSSKTWLKEAQDQFQNNFKFKMSHVQINTKAPSTYVSTTVKTTVNLKGTQMAKCFAHPTHCTPKPTMSCKECAQYKDTQALDITALIDNVSEPRVVNDRKRARDIVILDGTLKANSSSPGGEAQGQDELVKVKICIFYTIGKQSDGQLGDPEWVTELMDNASKGTPFHFYGIQAKKGSQFETMRHWFSIVPATATDDEKGQQLMAEFDKITKLKDNCNVVVLEKQWSPDGGENLQNVNGQETLCAHLDAMSQRTGIAELDGKATVWQCNWTNLTILPGSHLTEKGDKLWLKVLCQDVSGRVEARMGEKVALELAHLKSKDDFLQALSEGDAPFPTIVSLKLARKLKEIKSESEESNVFVNITVIAATIQDYTMTRTTTIRQVIPVLRTLTSMSSAILPTTRSMLTSSAAYPMQVQYPTQDLDAQPCQKVWILIKASKKSKCTDEPPYTVTTEDVEDVLDQNPAINDASQGVKYTLVTTCSKGARTSLTLTPSHGKSAFAVAVVTATMGNILCAESVEQVSMDEKAALSTAMMQEMMLATELVTHTSTGVAAPWSDATSPLGAAQCRSLGKSPTGPDLDPLEPTVKRPRHS